ARLAAARRDAAGAIGLARPQAQPRGAGARRDAAPRGSAPAAAGLWTSRAGRDRGRSTTEYARWLAIESTQRVAIESAALAGPTDRAPGHVCGAARHVIAGEERHDLGPAQALARVCGPCFQRRGRTRIHGLRPTTALGARKRRAPGGLKSPPASPGSAT